ncbi:hypothetical protein M8371_04320, partial [Klebsiella pneumoniae]|nr:hypothetical protein [Klebsiella pneumoniae]
TRYTSRRQRQMVIRNSIESGRSIYMILATSGISGAMGSVALTYLWERITGVKAP